MSKIKLERPLVPAHPGYFALIKSEPLFRRVPVVAWYLIDASKSDLVEEKVITVPVTIEGDVCLLDLCGIEHPDKTISAKGRSFTDINDFTSYMIVNRNAEAANV